MIDTLTFVARNIGASIKIVEAETDSTLITLLSDKSDNAKYEIRLSPEDDYMSLSIDTDYGGRDGIDGNCYAEILTQIISEIEEKENESRKEGQENED